MTDTTLPNFARAVLDKIASGEARSYDLLFGGHRFKSYSDHPKVKIPLGNGLYSTAAGRYQMIAPTWQREKEALGLPDFSPASQDLAAWSLAQRAYKQKTGRDLSADAQAGQVDYSALADKWSSLRGRSPQVQAAAAAPPGATQVRVPQAPLPDFSNPLDILHQMPKGAPPPLGSLPLARPGAGLSLYKDRQFEPVEHNPFAGALPVVPVDHDPFAVETKE